LLALLLFVGENNPVLVLVLLRPLMPVRGGEDNEEAAIA
jgi:hypothetical protein